MTAPTRPRELRLPAIEIRQGARRVYSFAADGTRLNEFTTVSRVRRDRHGLAGYQRPEVASHIAAIRRYLESDSPLLPNALVVAFDHRVVFEPHPAPAADPLAAHGHLVIPLPDDGDEQGKPGLLVDGQQRAAALAAADLPLFPVPIVGFIAGEEEQRAQFVLVNTTKPLPRGLVNELLPETEVTLPPRYARRKLPARLMLRLNTDHDSPFRGRIVTPTQPGGVIRDNAVLTMIQNSLYEGALWQYRDPTTGDGDTEAMLAHLKTCWTVIAATFPHAWALPPRRSRLTHGAGIVAAGFAMDTLTENVPANGLQGVGLADAIARWTPITAWTSGTWHISDTDQRPWNAIQNTSTDIRLLTRHLLAALPRTRHARPT